MEIILNNDGSVDISQLDQLVTSFYSSHGGIEQGEAGRILTIFQQNPESWKQSDKILQNSKVLQTKFIGLSILDDLIKTRWNTLPPEDKNGIFNFIIGMIMSLVNINNTSERKLIQKADLILVQILKKDWSKDFIQNLIESATNSREICENNLYILQLIAEEIFIFSKDSLTQARREKLMSSLSSELTQIFSFCVSILQNNSFNLNFNDFSIEKSSLKTLQKFINWLPTNFIYESSILELLTHKYILNTRTRQLSLKCLIEIANISVENNSSNNNNEIFKIQTITLQYYENLLNQVNNNILTSTSSNLSQIYDNCSIEDQWFLNEWALFLTTFLTRNRILLESQNIPLLLESHEYILQLTEINEREMFKIVLEYWQELASSLFLEIENFPFDQTNPYMKEVSLGSGAINPLIFKKFPLRRNIYNEICSKLRMVIINQMVKPEEVIVVKSEDGEFFREIIADSDHLQLYQTEREVMVYLTHLDIDNMEKILWGNLEKICEQKSVSDNDEFDNDSFNKICWAIGSISGTMRVELEQEFIMKVLNKLWIIYEKPLTGESKIILSSNIMYIVGQYPRFLKNQWKFFKRVMFQLFDLMHDNNEAIKDMACDTFLKITKKCKYQMATIQSDDADLKPFIRTILDSIENIISDLSPSQGQLFYESCGMIISNSQSHESMALLTSQLMKRPNLTWSSLISQFRLNSMFLAKKENCKILINLIRTNLVMSKTLTSDYFEQIQHVYLDMLDIYKQSSSLIQESIQKFGDMYSNSPGVRVLVLLKREILRLLGDFIGNTKNYNILIYEIVDSFFNATLNDYKESCPDVKESELLNCLTILIDKLENRVPQKVQDIFEYTFKPTLEMITKDLIAYPDHRLSFYKLFNTINSKCFGVIAELSEIQFNMFFDCICWAFKHTNLDIEELGLEMALTLLNKLVRSRDLRITEIFFQDYYLIFVNETFYILTEPDHKATFSEQSLLLMRLLSVIYDNQIAIPVFKSVDASTGTSNKEYLMTYMTNLLCSVFPNMTKLQVETFLQVLIRQVGNTAQFQSTLRDFLIQIKEIGGDPYDYLFAEEKLKELQEKKLQEEERALKVAGLMKPSELIDAQEMRAALLYRNK